MILGLSNGLIAAILGAMALWAALSFIFIPRMRKELLRSNSSSASQISAKIAGTTVLRDISFTALIAGVTVVVGAFLLNQQLKSYDAGEAGIQSAVALRDKIESVLDKTGDVSAGIWLSATAGLGLLWLLLARSSSRRRWQAAIDARKSALLNYFKDKTGDELRAELEAANAGVLADLDAEAVGLKTANERRIEIARDAGVLVGPGFTLSYNQLLEIGVRMAEELAAPAAEGDEEARKQGEETLAGIRQRIAEIEQGLMVELQLLGGGSRNVKLAEAPAAAAPTQEDFERAARDALVEARTRNHLADADFKARSEPELLREWLGTGLTF